MSRGRFGPSGGFGTAGDPAFKDDNLESMQAFSTGPRNCIGRKYVSPFSVSFTPTSLCVHGTGR